MNTGFTSFDDEAIGTPVNIATLDLMAAPPVDEDVFYIELPRAKPGTRDYRIEEDGTGRVRLRIGPLVTRSTLPVITVPDEAF